MKTFRKVCFLFLITSLGLQAQFYGGNGDGFSSAIATSTLAGEEISLFYGGNGDGFSLGIKGAFLSVNGPCVEALIKQIDTDPITSGLYEAGSQLLSKGKVRSGNIVNFSAGNSIILEPGFIAENNALFLAIIKNCLTNPVNY